MSCCFYVRFFFRIFAFSCTSFRIFSLFVSSHLVFINARFLSCLVLLRSLLVSYQRARTRRQKTPKAKWRSLFVIVLAAMYQPRSRGWVGKISRVGWRALTPMADTRLFPSHEERSRPPWGQAPRTGKVTRPLGVAHRPRGESSFSSSPKKIL